MEKGTIEKKSEKRQWIYLTIASIFSFEKRVPIKIKAKIFVVEYG